MNTFFNFFKVSYVGKYVGKIKQNLNQIIIKTEILTIIVHYYLLFIRFDIQHKYDYIKMFRLFGFDIKLFFN
jgi:hypothetical protein